MCRLITKILSVLVYITLSYNRVALMRVVYIVLDSSLTLYPNVYIVFGGTIIYNHCERAYNSPL